MGMSDANGRTPSFVSDVSRWLESEPRSLPLFPLVPSLFGPPCCKDGGKSFFLVFSRDASNDAGPFPMGSPWHPSPTDDPARWTSWVCRSVRRFDG